MLFCTIMSRKVVFSDGSSRSLSNFLLPEAFTPKRFFFNFFRIGEFRDVCNIKGIKYLGILQPRFRVVQIICSRIVPERFDPWCMSLGKRWIACSLCTRPVCQIVFNARSVSTKSKVVFYLRLKATKMSEVSFAAKSVVLCPPWSQIVLQAQSTNDQPLKFIDCFDLTWNV